jgi:hypothetical protein
MDFADSCTKSRNEMLYYRSIEYLKCFKILLKVWAEALSNKKAKKFQIPFNILGAW